MLEETTNGRRLGRRPIVHKLNIAYRGETDAHQCMEHIQAAVDQLVCAIVAGFPAATLQECRAHIRQARAWLTTANLDDLDHATRRDYELRLRPLYGVIDVWIVTHHDDQRQTSITEIFQALGAVTVELYREREHWQRLSEEGHVTEQELEHADDLLEDVTWAEVQAEEILTKEELADVLREVDDALATLPPR